MASVDILRDREEEYKSGEDTPVAKNDVIRHLTMMPFIKPVDEDDFVDVEMKVFEPTDKAVLDELLAIIQDKNQSAQEEEEEMPRPRVPVHDDYNVHIDVKAFPRDGEAYVQILEEPPIIEPVEDLVKEPVVEPLEEPVVEPLEEPVVEPVVEPVEEPAEDIEEEPTEEPYTTEEITENFSRVFQRMEEMETEIKELREGVGALREIISRYNDVFTTIISLIPNVPPSRNTRFTDEEDVDVNGEVNEDGERNETEGNDEDGEEEEEDDEDWFNDMCTVM